VLAEPVGWSDVNQVPIGVLLIEDDPRDARLIGEGLRDAAGAAFQVDCASRLATGLERLRAGGVQVILLDLGLPDSQGLATFTSLYARAPNVPIIVLSDLSDESLAIATLREGAQDYLVKGQSDGHLLARSIRYAIERKRAEDRIR
jgi:two-component system, cell cycle sensor histidine kinase and response regulator CckA